MARCVRFAVALVLFVVSGEARPLGLAGAADEALVKRARAIHDRVIALDTHDDINPENVGNRLRVMADVEKVARQIQSGQK